MHSLVIYFAEGRTSDALMEQKLQKSRNFPHARCLPTPEGPERLKACGREVVVPSISVAAGCNSKLSGWAWSAREAPETFKFYERALCSMFET